MISFPNAKINIGLNITDKREDGFHNIETVFYPINWHDVLEIIPAKEFSFNISGTSDFLKEFISDSHIPITVDNLCVHAYKMLQVDYDLPPVEIVLLKNIPIGAGLGGGSSDAAKTLQMLNEMFEIGLDHTQLRNHAVQLGADCSFFLDNKPMLATGVGDQLSKINTDLSGFIIVVIYPRVPINTANAYSMIKPEQLNRNLRELLNSPISQWKDQVINGFENVVFPRHPEVKDLKTSLYDLNATYVSMSGSGSAVYAFFKRPFDEYVIKQDERFADFDIQID